jgi:hypothetical protein
MIDSLTLDIGIIDRICDGGASRASNEIRRVYIRRTGSRTATSNRRNPNCFQRGLIGVTLEIIADD